MSGTSSDGVDAALVSFNGNPEKPTWSLLNFISIEYPSELRKCIIAVGQGKKLNASEFLELSEEITEFHANVAISCDPKGLASLIGCHGQTIYHRPPVGDKRGMSWQMLQAPLLAILVNRSVVYDFRSKDLALGGQGAPLVPLTDAALIGRGLGWRAILNLGGIANISLIPPKNGPCQTSSILGWDSGPANTLIDLAVQKISNGQLNYDRDGRMATKGKPNLKLINAWLQEPFFQKRPPKSTGREQFGLLDLECRLEEMGNDITDDFIATLTAFSAAVIAQDFNHIYQEKSIKPLELFVAGGGAKNPFFFNEIVRRCKGMRVCSIQELGIPVQAREAISFALLAWWNLLNKSGSSKETTGIERVAILGTKVNPY